MENLLILTNNVLNKIIISKKKDDKISEDILPSINTILEGVIPIIKFFTNEKLSQVFFEQNTAISELLQIHYNFIELTKDSPDFDKEILEDYLVNWYDYNNKTKIFSTYLTTMETTNNELSELEELPEIKNSDQEALVGGGIPEATTKLLVAAAVVVNGLNVVQATQANQMAQSSNQFAVQQSSQNNYEYLKEKGVTVLPSIYTSPLGASMGAVEASNGAFYALSKAILGDNYGKAMEGLLGTVAEVNIANNYICTQAIRELSPYFEGPVFDSREYNAAEDVEFVKVLEEVGDVIDGIDINVQSDGKWPVAMKVLPPVSKEQADLEAEVIAKAKAVEGLTITPAEAARFNSDLHATVSEIIQRKRKKEEISKLLEKEKLFELGKICNERLFSVNSEGGEALILIDLQNNAFRTATYEKILDKFKDTPNKSESQLAQINKLEYVLRVLDPVSLLGTLSGILAQSHRTTPVIIQEVNVMLAKYRDDLNIIRRHNDPGSVYNAIKKREDDQAEEEQRRIQSEFDIELTKNATKLAEKETNALVESREAATNNTERSLHALSSYWSAWISGSVGVVLDPLAAGVDKGVGVVTDLAVNQTYDLFIKIMKIVGMCIIILGSTAFLASSFASFPAIIRGVSSRISRMITAPPSAAAAPAAPAAATTAAVARARRSRWGDFVPVSAPVGTAKKTQFGPPVNAQNIYDLDQGFLGGKNKQTRKKNKHNKKNKHTKKTKQTKKNKRTKKNRRARKNKSHKK
jgi:hypothetical protein